MQATLTILALLTVTSVLTAEPLTLNVEKGDTLYSIGREYDVPVDRLIEANGIINPRQLKQGMRIVVPNTYVVQSGDTLYSLARRHDTTVKRLCELNGIEPDALLQIGTVIRLPAAEGEEEASTRLAEQNPEPAEQEEGEREKQVLEERKKQDARETPVRPARYAKGEKPQWPHSGERMHLTGKLKGTQISGAKGDEVVSVAAGRVVWVAPYRGYGKLVMVEAPNGMIYAYGGHEEIYVEVGERVKPGTVIGTLGINPVEKNAKAFFFVYKNGKPIDPEQAPRG